MPKARGYRENRRFNCSAAEALPGGGMAGRGAGNYPEGKKGEAQTKEDYLPKAGFVVPTAAQRKNIVAAFERHGVVVHKSGFDAVRADHAPFLDSVDEIENRLEELRLYEVKTCGAERKSEVSVGFKGLGFTLTGKEHHNAKVLGPRYRFLFVNLRTGTHRECALTDFFFQGRARIYLTWSVFLVQDLPPVDSAEPGAAPDRRGT